MILAAEAALLLFAVLPDDWKVAAIFLNAYREYRDNFGKEIFRELGYDQVPAVFTRAELMVAFGVMAALGALNLIKDNRRGLAGAFAIITGGAALLGLSCVLRQNDLISGFQWMVLVGLSATGVVLLVAAGVYFMYKTRSSASSSVQAGPI